MITFSLEKYIYIYSFSWVLLSLLFFILKYSCFYGWMFHINVFRNLEIINVTYRFSGQWGWTANIILFTFVILGALICNNLCVFFVIVWLLKAIAHYLSKHNQIIWELNHFVTSFRRTIFFYHYEELILLMYTYYFKSFEVVVFSCLSEALWMFWNFSSPL